MRPFSALLALLVLGCAEQSVDVPEPPDMSPLLAAYQAPSAPLSADTVAEIVAKRQEIADQFERLGGLEPILAALGVLSSDTSSTASALAGPDGTESVRSALQDGSLTISNDGYLLLTRTCAGWQGARTPDPADGTITLTAVFADEVFDAVVWGEATGCRYLVDGHRLTLDGQVRIHTGTLLVNRDPNTEITIEFNESAALDGEAHATGFSFRLALSSSRIEVELDVSAGNVVFFADETSKAYGFRAANGTWTCDFEAGTCTHDDDTLSLW